MPIQCRPTSVWGPKRQRTLSLSQGCWETLQQRANQTGISISELVEVSSRWLADVEPDFEQIRLELINARMEE